MVIPRDERCTYSVIHQLRVRSIIAPRFRINAKIDSERYTANRFNKESRPRLCKQGWERTDAKQSIHPLQAYVDDSRRTSHYTRLHYADGNAAIFQQISGKQQSNELALQSLHSL